jgi:hypothetical protein
MLAGRAAWLRWLRGRREWDILILERVDVQHVALARGLRGLRGLRW